MAEKHDITFDSSPVGSAQMEKQGLYCLFSCRCNQPDTGLYRIHVIYGDKREDLGICVPMGDMFGMDKKLPVKKLGTGTPSFELLPRDWSPRPAAEEPEPVPEEPAQEEQCLPEKELQQETETVLPEPEVESLPQAAQQACFIPVSGVEPFDCLDRLENARMEIRDDTPGIVIHSPVTGSCV